MAGHFRLATVGPVPKGTVQLVVSERIATKNPAAIGKLSTVQTLRAVKNVNSANHIDEATCHLCDAKLELRNTISLDRFRQKPLVMRTKNPEKQFLTPQRRSVTKVARFRTMEVGIGFAPQTKPPSAIRPPNHLRTTVSRRSYKRSLSKGTYQHATTSCFQQAGSRLCLVYVRVQQKRVNNSDECDYGTVSTTTARRKMPVRLPVSRPTRKKFGPKGTYVGRRTDDPQPKPNDNDSSSPVQLPLCYDGSLFFEESKK